MYDGKRHLWATNFFWAKTKADHDAEHAVASGREIVLHIHVSKVVTVCRSDGGTVCYKDRRDFYDFSKANRRARVINARNHALLRFDASGGRSPSFLLPRRSWMMSDRSRFHVRFRGSGESEMTAPLFRIARIS